MSDEVERRDLPDSEADAAARRAARASWPIKMYRLGEEPDDDITATTTMEERLAVMAELAVFAYALAGHPFPTQPWSEMPFFVQRGGPRPSDE